MEQIPSEVTGHRRQKNIPRFTEHETSLLWTEVPASGPCLALQKPVRTHKTISRNILAKTRPSN